MAPRKSFCRVACRYQLYNFLAGPGLSLVALILIAGSLLLLWFVILSGVTTTTPLDKTYFLRADTAGITGARSISQWNYFYVCGDGNTNCGSASPAPPAGHAWAPNAANVPSGLAGSHGNHTTSARFFYMWRFGWAFYLIALFFMTLTFFSGFLACCGRLGAAISALFGVLSLIIYTAAVSLMTYVHTHLSAHFASKKLTVLQSYLCHHAQQVQRCWPYGHSR